MFSIYFSDYPFPYLNKAGGPCPQLPTITPTPGGGIIGAGGIAPWNMSPEDHRNSTSPSGVISGLTPSSSSSSIAAPPLSHQPPLFGN